MASRISSFSQPRRRSVCAGTSKKRGLQKKSSSGVIEGFQRYFQDDIIRDSQDISKNEKEEKEAQFRYEQLPLQEQEMVNQILFGCHPLESLPQMNQRIVRVFISSTFTDFTVERNALMKATIPKLQTYCRERYGVQFQAIDLRWGVTSRNRDEHSIEDICIKEIQHCQQQSIGPNFVTFLGQKHGHKSIPAQIVYTDYEPLKKVLDEMKDYGSLFDQWYKKDKNAVPTVYVLQPISSVLGEDSSAWEEIHRNLYDGLLEAAHICEEQEQIDEEFLHHLKSSVTEIEVEEGFVKMTPLKRESGCFCIVRNISDLEDHLDSANAYRFIDLLKDSMTIDPVAQAAMANLRKNIVMPYCLAKNHFEENIKWSEPEGISFEYHKSYLEEFCNKFFNSIRDMIDSSMLQQERCVKDDLYEEVLQHWQLAKKRVETFHGRQSVLNDIMKYIIEDSCQPLVIHGDSGHGKTSITAKAASLVPHWLAAHGRRIQTTIALRFCGTSPASSNIRQLLRSLSHQIAYTSDLYRHEIPDDYKDLKKYFMNLVQQGEFKGFVVIFLDALDQLSWEDQAHNLDWLPPQIAKNIKIIVSTLPKVYSIYSKLNSKITDPTKYVEIPALSPNCCSEILIHWLQEHGRAVTLPQLRLLRKAFETCSLPLFVKLTFEDVVQWKSYTEIENLPLDITTCIECLFTQLEEQNGQVLVSHALAYITASQTGISESELIDLLSLDDQVLSSVFTYWEPPCRRAPPSLWARIHHKIKCYLVERETDETPVMYWYHRQFIEVARERYLSDFSVKTYIHSNLADFYLGKWSKTIEKPFQYEKFLMERLRLATPASKACRFVAEQPLCFTTFNNQERFNYRKLNQLPYHLAMAGRLEELNDQVYFNYEWIHTKLRACSVQQIISDYNLIIEADVNLVADALRMSESALAKNPNVLALEICGRLLPHRPMFENIEKLIHQCDLAAMKHCPLVANWQTFTSPGGPLQYVCEAEDRLQCDIDIGIIQTQDTVSMVAKPFHSPLMRIWDIKEGEPRPTLTLPTGCNIFPTPDGKFVNVFKHNGCLQIYRFDNGELYGEVTFPRSGNISQIAVSNKYLVFTLEQKPSPLIIDLEARLLTDRLQYQCQAVAICPKQRYVICGAGCILAIHELPLLERRCVTQTLDLAKKIVITKEGTKFYVMFQNKELRAYTVNLVHRNAKSVGMATDIAMRNVKLSHTEQHLLVRSSRSLYLFNTKTDTLKFRINKMPPGVFYAKRSTFADAGFSPNDEFIIAARHTYLGIWNTLTGEPLRLLQSSVSPIINLLTSDIVNKAITLLEDQSIQVWDLGQLQTDVQHNNAIVHGEIKALEVSTDGNRVICAGNVNAEAKIMSLDTGKCELTLVHSDEIDVVISAVHISPCGLFGVTCCVNTDVPEYSKEWELLTEAQLWNLESGEMLHEVTANRYVVFSSKDEKVAFLQCRQYSTFDWSVTAYDIILYNAKDNKTTIMEIPPGDLICKPIFTQNGETMVFILQEYSCPVSGTFDEKAQQTTIHLCAISFNNQWHGIQFHKIKDIWFGANDNDQFMDIRSLPNNKILIIYGKSVEKFTHNLDGSIDRSKMLPKGGLVYDVRKHCVLRRYDAFLHPNTQIDRLMFSAEASCVVDDKFQIFDLATNTCNTKMVKNDLEFQFSCTLLNGKYLAVLDPKQNQVLVYRTQDGVQKAQCFLHGTGTVLRPGPNDRTVVIGCKDGRVISLTLVLESCDAVVEVISKLPSRNIPVLSTNKKSIQINEELEISRNSSAVSPLMKDILRIKNYEKEDIQLTLSRQQVQEHKCQRNCRLIGDVVTLYRNASAESKACCIQ